MNTRQAREIRRGIVLARELIAGKRRRPVLTPFGHRDGPKPQLWELAFHREMTAAARDGRIRPPRGPSGIGGLRA